mmetsp:Transcript_51461/g.134399  ORF Transcript_51461/g.134399 Transcript_51461/m.134399 type:complete len:162 (+) Transcript_51461:184-669(+)
MSGAGEALTGEAFAGVAARLQARDCGGENGCATDPILWTSFWENGRGGRYGSSLRGCSNSIPWREGGILRFWTGKNHGVPLLDTKVELSTPCEHFALARADLGRRSWNCLLGLIGTFGFVEKLFSAFPSELETDFPVLGLCAERETVLLTAGHIIPGTLVR